MKIKMRYPLGNDNINDGKDHEIEPSELRRIYINGRTYYILCYNDFSVSDSMERGRQALLECNNGRFNKVPLASSNEYLTLLNTYYNDGEIVGLNILGESIGCSQITHLSDINKTPDEANISSKPSSRMISIGRKPDPPTANTASATQPPRRPPRKPPFMRFIRGLGVKLPGNSGGRDDRPLPGDHNGAQPPDNLPLVTVAGASGEPPGGNDDNPSIGHLETVSDKITVLQWLSLKNFKYHYAVLSKFVDLILEPDKEYQRFNFQDEEYTEITYEELYCLLDGLHNFYNYEKGEFKRINIRLRARVNSEEESILVAIPFYISEWLFKEKENYEHIKKLRKKNLRK